MSGRHPPLTTDRRLGAGAVLHRGASAPYRAVRIIEGEPHLLREDFHGAGQGLRGAGPGQGLRGAGPGQGLRGTGPGFRASAGRPLLCLAHITDLQLADVQSPARFEFLNRYFADPRYAEIVPVQRPQEALTAHAVDATLRTLNAVRGPVTGAAPGRAVTTPARIDNALRQQTQAIQQLFDW